MFDWAGAFYRMNLESLPGRFVALVSRRVLRGIALVGGVLTDRSIAIGKYPT